MVAATDWCGTCFFSVVEGKASDQGDATVKFVAWDAKSLSSTPLGDAGGVPVSGGVSGAREAAAKLTGWR